MIPVSRPDLSGNELLYVTDALNTGWLTHHGSYEKKFEDEFSRFVGRPAIATSSGTAALHLALLASGVGSGDEVIVPALTFAATASVVLAVGAKPLLVDVDQKCCIRPEGIVEAVRKSALRNRVHKVKAVIPVHLYGEACDMDSIKSIAKKYGLVVIEDSCEALGIVPPSADITCYSFYANKIITTGEGGMICGDFKNAEDWRNGGFDKNYYHKIPGLNYRMTNLQAAVGLAQLERIDDLLGRRLMSVKYYSKRLPGFGKWLFCVQTHDPQGLAKYLKANGVETRPVFYPLHLMPPFKQLGDFHNSELIWKTHLCLPTGPHLEEEDLENVVHLIHSFPDECKYVA